MDALSHAFLIYALMVAIGRPDLAAFAILGAVIPDIDVLFRRASHRSPRLYIFTHGGFTHSLLGASLLAALVYAAAGASAVIAPLSPFSGVPFGLLPLAAVIAGAWSHLAFDYLASPGIPLLYPLSDRKYTLNIFAGPSMVMFVMSISYLVLLLLGRASLADIPLFAAAFLVLLAARAALKVSVLRRVDGTVFPTPHALKWISIADRENEIHLKRYHCLRGADPATIFPKFLNITPPETE
ncbi:MAG TPA: metal-dependent hydrolase, partial [Methanomicrobiales archaeon]|nr:metal-dependent hydrolase [Methanomicrobiales archaeon]